jgi:hypothetical protein
VLWNVKHVSQPCRTKHDVGRRGTCWDGGRVVIPHNPQIRDLVRISLRSPGALVGRVDLGGASGKHTHRPGNPDSAGWVEGGLGGREIVNDLAGAGWVGAG